MGFAEDLAHFRAEQEKQLTATARVVRHLGDPVYDPVTGRSVQPVQTVLAAAPCKITAFDALGSDVEVGQTQARIGHHLVKFVHDAPVMIGDLIEITSSTYNPSDIGLLLRIVDIDRREWQIARRCVAEEISVPIDWQAEDDEEGS